MAAVEFDVLEPVKGQMGDTVVLLVRTTDTSCGAPQFMPERERTYFGRPASVQVGGGTTALDQCAALDPDYLGDVVPKTLPEVDPEVEAEIAVVGEWAGTDLRLYSRNGVLAAYGATAGVAGYSAAPCRGGTVMAQTSTADGVDMVVWRDMVTTETLGQTALGPRGASGGSYVTSCGVDLQALVARDDGWWLADMSGRLQQVTVATGRFAMDDDQTRGALALPGGDIELLDINSGEELGRVDDDLLGPGLTWGLGFNPSGSLLGIITNNGNPQLTVTNDVGAIEHQMDLPDRHADRLWWLDDVTLVYSGDDVHVATVAPGGIQWRSDLVRGSAVSHAGTRVLTRPTDGGATTLTDLVTGESSLISLPQHEGHHPIVLAEPLHVERASASPVVPGSGVHLPATLDGLRQIIRPEADSVSVGPFIQTGAQPPPLFAQGAFWISIAAFIGTAGVAWALLTRPRWSRLSSER